MYTFESLLQSAVKDNPAQLGSVMEKAKLRVLKVILFYPEEFLNSYIYMFVYI